MEILCKPQRDGSMSVMQAPLLRTAGYARDIRGCEMEFNRHKTRLMVFSNSDA